jgi:predicted DNA-binding transcriptional regulator AlpA
MADKGYVRVGDLVTLLKVSRTTIWAWRRTGLLPPPERLGPNTIRWPVEVIEQWRASRPRA